ncbi:hypothetical protein EPUS_09167 [Endocarpon pusillum Z07020]|uniref:Uncharacterized protein n=1 Tax=Endocarpon pusillum (strain Z07020 / HMAS-L-300199) TaxID=1263415 RepID=U1GU65_ENDPU|nr:uncharacterized protein EPUS_09167 [Endocarpon pusillum Z07020]ERF75571.1 hypothetical protein EPUS_09167 [Endocarpon pusillum Z07020]
MALSPITMLVSLIAALFSWTSTAQSQPLTGNQIITGLSFSCLSYQEFTTLILALPSEPGSSEAQLFIDQFNEYIDANVAGTAAVLENLPPPFSDVVQYAIQAVAFDLIRENRRFLDAVVAKEDSFTEDQQETLSDLVSQERVIVEQYLNGTSVYAPQVQDIQEPLWAAFLESVSSTVEALEN